MAEKNYEQTSFFMREENAVSENKNTAESTASEDNSARYAKMRQNFYDAASFKEPDKVPVGTNMFGWPFYYAGVKLTDVVHDPVKAAEAYGKFFDDFEIDFTWLANLPMPVDVFKYLGTDNYGYGEDGCCVNHLQAKEKYLGTEIYDEIIADPGKFMTETYVKRFYPTFQLPQEEAYPLYLKALDAAREYFVTSGLIAENIKNHGVFSIFDDIKLMHFSSFNKFFDNYRGIVGSLTDLRRMPKKVQEAVDALDAYKKSILPFTPENIPEGGCMGHTGYHAEGGFLNPKQYDNLYFKNFKETYLPYMEKGVKFFLLGEGSYLNTVERFRELPKGSMILTLDKDDPFEVHKKVGDWCTICCGIQTDMLATATKQECIDYVKKLFDVLAPGGGFMFVPNKSVCSARDAKVENMIAAYETANELSKK